MVYLCLPIKNGGSFHGKLLHRIIGSSNLRRTTSPCSPRCPGGRPFLDTRFFQVENQRSDGKKTIFQLDWRVNNHQIHLITKEKGVSVYPSLGGLHQTVDASSDRMDCFSRETLMNRWFMAQSLTVLKRGSVSPSKPWHLLTTSQLKASKSWRNSSKISMKPAFKSMNRIRIIIKIRLNHLNVPLNHHEIVFKKTGKNPMEKKKLCSENPPILLLKPH